MPINLLQKAKPLLAPPGAGLSPDSLITSGRRAFSHHVQLLPLQADFEETASSATIRVASRSFRERLKYTLDSQSSN
ncbi:hypothetical protein [Microviridae sp.]|nr:hypothetical protein [Microviridae sp.]